VRIGIDLGGTKIEGIVLSNDGLECSRTRVPTPQGDYKATLQAICALVNQITKEANAPVTTPIGIGIPGIISPRTGLIKNANSVCLIGNMLDKDLETILKRPVKLANDADCFAISEATDGAGTGARIVFGVILGTGVGGGIVFNSQLLSGPNAITGEWGHMPLPWPQTLEDGHDEQPGPDCYCGLKGCIETYLSGPSLVRDHKLNTNQSLETNEISNRANSGDQKSDATLTRYEHRLARGLSNVINLLDPDVIVLGGGISNIRRLYDNVPRIWEQWIFSDYSDTRLVKNVHGDSSGIRGAAWL
jgi:fructokinase